MRAGDLHHRVRLQRQTLTDDLVGSDDAAYVDVATLWANVTTSGAREFWEAKRLNAALTHQVECRYRADIAPDMRFRFGDRVLRVVGAPMDPDGRRIRLLCMCTELVQ